MTTIDDWDDIEDRVRDLGRTVAAPPLPGAAAVMERGRRRRRHRRGRMAAVLVVTGAGGALGVQVLRAGSGEPTVQVTTADPADGGADDGTTSSLPPLTTPSTTAPTDMAALVAVPDVIGLESERAVAVLQDIGFQVEVRGDDHDDAIVLAQEPAPALTAEPGSDMILHVG